MDTCGAFLSGLQTFVISPEEVPSSTDDFNTIPGTHQLHQLTTTSTPGKLLIRKRSCFTCPPCEEGDYAQCRRTEELGPVTTFKMTRTPTWIAERQAESGDSEEVGEQMTLAVLAEPGSVIAVDIDANDTITIILVTSPLGSLRFKDELKGKKLIPLQQQNCFSLAGAKVVKFDAKLVRSPPLQAVKKSARNGAQKIRLRTISVNIDLN